MVAQEKNDYVWLSGCCEGELGAIKINRIDFSKTPSTIMGEVYPYGFLTQNVTQADNSGNLLFSCNGRAVFNRLGQIMTNGRDINAGEWIDLFWPDPNIGHPGRQDIIVLEDPAKADGYYLIHKTRKNYASSYDSMEIRMTYIDMEANAGMGDIVFKNQYFYTKRDNFFSYLTAIRHDNQRDWWILQPMIGRSLKTFLLDTSGIQLLHDQDPGVSFTIEKTSASGTARFSPDGNKYVLYNEFDGLLIYNFNRKTGKIDFQKKLIPIDTMGTGILCSVEWSPNGRYLYTATSIYLHQIDTWESDPVKAVTLIDKYNGTLDPFATDFFLLALGPDCRIYMTPANGSNSLHIIKEPDKPGKSCNFVQNGIKLPSPNGGGFPNFPRYRVDDNEKCDPTISSVFGEAVYYRRDLLVFPNPSTGQFTIKIPALIGGANLVITNTDGKTILHKKVDNLDIEEIDLSTYPSGHYNVEIYPITNPSRIFYGRQVVKVN